MKNNKKKTSIIIAGIVASIWLLVGAGFLGAWLSTRFGSANVPNISEYDGNTVVTAAESDLAELVKKVSPSVVSVVTTKVSSGYYSRTSEGAGTGIIISSDGYILTNKHVVQGSGSITVIQSDGSQHNAVKLIGTDPLNDLAILKIDKASGLPEAKLGDSGTVRVGQNVIAIGNSLGQYQNTVTSGIISGLGRPVSASLDSVGSNIESLNDLLQTDAAINPGNSGGPLINMAGQVIGINTAIVSDAQSIGFAIPINAAKGIIKGVVKGGAVSKAYLGVEYISITPDIRAEYDLSEKQGALVRGREGGSPVVKGSPAEKAGIRDGDIITKVNDKTVGEHGGLSSLIAEFVPGDEVKLTIIRDSKSIVLSLKLGSYTL